MRIGPAPLVPAYPVQPDREVVYPRALGQAYVGNPRLALPDVKAKVMDTPETRKAFGPPSEQVSPKPVETDPQTAKAAKPERQGLGRSRPPLGTLMDVKA